MLRRKQSRRRNTCATAIALTLCIMVFTGCAAVDKSRLQPPQIMFNNTNREGYQRLLREVKPYTNLPDSFYRLGRYYQRSGKHVQAIESFKKMLEIQPDAAKAFNAIGVSYDVLGDCTKAQKAYSKALRYQPDLTYVHNNLGYSYLICGEIDLAITHLKKAAELDAGSSRIANNLFIAESKATGLARNFSFQKQCPPVQVPLNSAFPKIRTVWMDSKEKPANTHINIQEPIVIQSKSMKTNIDQDHTAESIITSRCSIEIANGNGVNGMAQKSAGYLRRIGLQIQKITNAVHFNYTDSIIYYKNGHEESAYFLSELLPGHQQVKQQDADAEITTDIKVVLGKNMNPYMFDNFKVSSLYNQLISQNN